MRLTRESVTVNFPHDPFVALRDANTGQATALVPRETRLRVEPEPDDGFPVGFSLEVDVHVEEGAPVIRRLVLDAADSEEPITAQAMRYVPLAELLTLAYPDRALVRDPDNPERWNFVVDASADDEVVAAVRRAKRVTITEELLREVARVYSDNINHAPIEAVARHFNKPRKTVERWVAQARDPERGGFLPSTQQGRARGAEDEA